MWRSYAYWWALVWLPCGAMVALAGLVLDGPTGALGFGLATAVGGALARRIAEKRFLLGRYSSRIAIGRHLAEASVPRVAAIAGLVGAGVHACGAVLGSTIWPVAGLAVLTSPAAVAAARSWLRARSRSAAGPGRGRVDPARTEELAVLAQSMSDGDLCRVWVETLAQVRSAGTPAELEEVLLQREVCLSELERRHPRAAAAWLAAPDRCAGPERWLDDVP